MEINREDTGALTASIKLDIGPADYEENVNKTLKDYQRKTNMPGFRPGKVPFGLVSKLYRKGVLLDEINHIISDNIQKYVEENDLKLIGQPLPDREKTADIDLDNNTDFSFYFDIGLVPEFNLDVKDISVDFLTIRATEKMIDENIHELRVRDKNQSKAEEHEHENDHDHDHDHDHEHNHDHKHEQDSEKEEELPELNEAFFNKIFPGEEVKDEKAFRARIKDVIEHSLVKESERFFLNSAVEKLVDETQFDLPDDFIKKMIREEGEDKYSEEEIDKQFDNFSKSVRWQLIESKLVKDNDIHVKEDEMRDVVKSYFSNHLANPGEDPEHDERLNKIVDSVLSNKEESNRLHNQLFDQKMYAFLKENIKLKEKEVDYDEFLKMVTQKKD